MTAPSSSMHPLALYLRALQSTRDALTDACGRAQAPAVAERLQAAIARLDDARDAFLVGVFTGALAPSESRVTATQALSLAIARTAAEADRAAAMLRVVDAYLRDPAAVATSQTAPSMATPPASAPTRSGGGLLSSPKTRGALRGPIIVPPAASFTGRTERAVPPTTTIGFGSSPTRGSRDMPALPVTAPAPAQAPAPSDRYVNVALEDTPADAILQVGTWYTLALDVDVAARAQSLATTALADDGLFPDGIDEVVLTVQLDSPDFDIADPTRTVRLPRTGPSHNKARFDLTPKHDGPSSITATLHKDGNFVQSIAITFVVGAACPVPIETTARGRPAGSAAMLKPRDVGIRLALAGDGYDCAIWGAVSSGARLPLQPAYLAGAVEALRGELMKVVMYQDANGAYVFQTGIDIADVDRDAALKTMARAGALLFQKLFFGPAAGDDSKRVGTFLRQVASDPAKRLDLQVVAEVAPIPWGLLYVGDASAGATLDWNLFLGMRHVIEEIPLQTTMAVVDSEIDSDPRLSVSVNVNSGIDAQLGGTYVADTNAYWAKVQASRKSVGVTSRTSSADVMHALADASTDDQIAYFYCHAESAGLGDPGGPDASALVLTDARITLADLALDAPTTTTLRGQPLVFINACESAELSPSFYDGFVPYFMAKGARGVIGTQCKTPALFAVEWASRFFDRFLDGAALGEAFLDLRREFLEQHGNPLGLLYAVHCDGDTRIEPALV